MGLYFLFLFIAAVAVTAFQDFHLHYRKLPANKLQNLNTHEVIFGLKRDNLDFLETKLAEISDPFHSTYGQHMTKADIIEYTRTDRRYYKLTNFLESQGFVITSLCCDYVKATGLVSEWETFFTTKFHPYKAISPYYPLAYRQRTHYRASSPTYSIPPEIRDDISDIFHVNDFPPPIVPSLNYQEVADPNVMQYLQSLRNPSTKVSTRERQTSSLRGIQSGMPISNDLRTSDSIALEWIGVIDGYVTPSLLNQVYDIRSNKGNNLTNQCTYQSGSWFSAVDLIKFQEYFSLPKEKVFLDIGQTQNDTMCRVNEEACGEANLDLQYIMAVAQHVPTIMYEWGDGAGVLDPWLAWILEVSNMTSPPDVISISYISYEYQIDLPYARAFLNEAIILALQGVTILAASGDDGVSGYFVKKNLETCGYFPMFPASCPYVTTIGGTSGPEYGREEEVVCAVEADKVFITTGGGFSNLYATPSWQKKQVQQYFSQVTPPAGSGHSPYNASGRGYPDISAVGNKYLVVINEKIISVSGTSASCPVVAAMVTLINSERLLRNASRLGWINPLLYAENVSSLFVKDVVKGNNSCTAVAGLCCEEGFPATPGWDASVGQGVLNFTIFREVALGLVSIASMKTWQPSARPTAIPTYTPSYVPTAIPTTSSPSFSPTTSTPTFTPSAMPTREPTYEPSFTPSAAPTTNTPTYIPTAVPSATPIPSVNPTSIPSSRPSISHQPSYAPTLQPTMEPTMIPTATPTTVQPSAVPSWAPTRRPTTYTPTSSPTLYYEMKQITFQVAHEIAPLLSTAQATYQAQFLDSNILSKIIANITCTQMFNNSIELLQKGLVHCVVLNEQLAPKFITTAPTLLPTTSPTASGDVTNTVSLLNNVNFHHGRRLRNAHSHTDQENHRRPVTTTSQEYLAYLCSIEVRVALATLLEYAPNSSALQTLLANTTDDDVIFTALSTQLPAILSDLTAAASATTSASTTSGSGVDNIQSVLRSLDPVLFGDVSTVSFAQLVSNSIAVTFLPNVFPLSRTPTRAPTSSNNKENISPEGVSKGLWNASTMLIVIVIGTVLTVMMCMLVVYTCCCYEPPYDPDMTVKSAETAEEAAAKRQQIRSLQQQQQLQQQQRRQQQHLAHNGIMDEGLAEQEAAELAAALAISAEEAEEHRRQKKLRKQQHKQHRKRGMHPLLRSTVLPLTGPMMTEEERNSVAQQQQAYVEYQQRKRTLLQQQQQQQQVAQQLAQQQRAAEKEKKRKHRGAHNHNAVSPDVGANSLLTSVPTAAAGSGTIPGARPILNSSNNSANSSPRVMVMQPTQVQQRPHGFPNTQQAQSQAGRGPVNMRSAPTPNANPNAIPTGMVPGSNVSPAASMPFSAAQQVGPRVGPTPTSATAAATAAAGFARPTGPSGIMGPTGAAYRPVNPSSPINPGTSIATATSRSIPPTVRLVAGGMPPGGAAGTTVNLPAQRPVLGAPQQPQVQARQFVSPAVRQQQQPQPVSVSSQPMAVAATSTLTTAPAVTLTSVVPGGGTTAGEGGIF